MCRICGRVVRCIFDSMPSRTPSTVRSFSTAVRSQSARHASSRQLLRATFNINARISHPPPSFLLPHRAKLHQVSATLQEATHPAQFQNTQPHIPSQSLTTQTPQTPSTPATSSNATATTVSPPTPPSKPLVISKSLQTLLPALISQPPYFITTHVHRFPYLLTAGDTLRLPFHLHGVSPGDILRLNRASIIGSRDYTLKAGMINSESYDAKRTGDPQYLDERLFECRVRVVGLESQPMTVKEKTKRRNRRVKKAKSKHRYTVVKVMEVKVKSLDELKADKGVMLLE